MADPSRSSSAASTRPGRPLVEGATAGVRRRPEDEVEVHEVPGAFELPLAARYCAESGRYAGVACLGAVIRGETDHYDYVCSETANGISRVGLDTGVPCSFGVLTVDTRNRRSRGSGRSATRARTPPRRCCEMVELRRHLA